MEEPLTLDKEVGNIEQAKKPILLYIIIVILIIIIIVLSILLGIEINKKKCKEESINPINEKNFIPVTQSFYTNDIENGAYSYHGCNNHLDSEYYNILDVYNMKKTDNRAILTHFKTYQQTSEFSSPCSLIIMILTYFNKEAPGERQCSLDFGLDPENGCAKGTYNRTEVFEKSKIPLFVDQLKNNYKLDVESNADYTEDTMPFQDVIDFGVWVKKNINDGNIIIVLYNDWAGQYAAIIGIDDMGTEDTADDVLILADAYDSTDHLQDGYTIWGLERFYSLWQESVISFYKDDDSLNHGQFILVKKPTS